jgi:hypothetical protein
VSRRVFNAGLGAWYSNLPWWLQPGGVFQVPSYAEAALCMQFPSVCSTETNQAAAALLYPDLAYQPGVVQPPAHAAVPAGYSSTPISVSEAQSEIQQSITDQEVANQQAQLQAAIDTARSIAAAPGGGGDGDGLPAPTNWWMWIAIGTIGVFAAVAIAVGSPRRYGP